MNAAVFSTKPFERESLTHAAGKAHRLTFLEPKLDASTASLAAGCHAVVAFVNDRLDAPCLAELAKHGVKHIALRSAGFNNVDLAAATKLGFTVARVPAYSPYAVAEHAIALLLTLNRKTHRAYNRVREQNFALDGLMGFDLHGKVAGVVGTGKIGRCVVAILKGFGCNVLAFDPTPHPECIARGVRYVELPTLLAESDVVTLHCPLTPATKHMIDRRALAAMKPGAYLINTGRGALIDTADLITALKSGRLGAVGLDVYEEEADLFFRDLSMTPIQDDIFARLMTFPNVLITGHQGFFTREALANIADTTAANLTGFETGNVPTDNLVALKPG